MLLDAFRLLLHRLARPRLDDVGVAPRDERLGHFPIALIIATLSFVGIRRPHDVLLRRLIDEQFFKQFQELQPQNGISDIDYHSVPFKSCLFTL